MYAKFPPGPAHSTTLSAQAATITVSGLNGDIEGQYLIDGELFINASSNQVSFLPNSQSSNLIGAGTDFAVGAAADASGGTTWTIARNSGLMSFASGQKVYVTGILKAKTGNVRTVNLTFLATGAANAFAAGFSRDRFTIDGAWTDTSAVLTTFQVSSNQANGFAAASYIRLTPLFIT